jgi:hypothetical protein
MVKSIYKVIKLFLDDFDDDEEEDEEDLELDRSSTIGPNSYAPVNNPGSGKARSANLRVSNPDMDNLRPGQIIKTREFWVLWMTFFLNTLPIGYINSMYKVCILSLKEL